MRKSKFLLLLVSLLLLLSACAMGTDAPVSETSAEPCSDTIFAMDTVMDFQIYGSEELLTEAKDMIFSLEQKFSVTDEGSDIHAVNENKTATVSDETAELLTLALELCARTDGALDVSVYPVLKTWGFTTGAYWVPETAEIEALLSSVDFSNITVDDQNCVTIGQDMEIDLGSVAKGYASSQVVQYLKSQGVTSALLNLGGNVHALGAKPDGSPWRIAIADPFGKGNLGVMEITDKAVITSGGYERYFEENGQTYWHIIDPSTGCPADSGLISVTIVGEDGVLCDALSTALFVMGLDAAADLWRASADFEAVFVSEDGTVTITEGLAGCFSLVESYQGAEVTVLYRD